MRAEEDFDAYVRARTPALLRSAFLLSGDQHLAEDLVQSALIRTHRAWSRVRDGHPEAYTRKVMYKPPGRLVAPPSGAGGLRCRAVRTTAAGRCRRSGEPGDR